MKPRITKRFSNGICKRPFSFYPTTFQYIPLFKACANLNLPLQALSLHAHTIKAALDHDIYIATSLTSMYMKLHLLKNAHKVFAEMPQRNIVSVNSIISGLSRNGCCKDAFVVFNNVFLGEFGVSVGPNSATIASLLSGCGVLEHGVQVHGFGVKLGVEMDVYVGTALLTMYSNCGEFVSALRVFGGMGEKNVVTFNALIRVFSENEMIHRVLDLFKVMKEALSETPTSVTWISVLSACSVLVDIRFGMQVHCLILKYEFDIDVKVGTALVDMYCKCGCWTSGFEIFNEMGCRKNLFTWNSMIAGMFMNGQCESAVQLFEQLELEKLVPDSISWNSMISGFSQCGRGVEAFSFFNQMLLTGVSPSLKTVTSLFPACSCLSAFRSGKEIHGYTIRSGIQADEFFTTSLIDMYMKCGYSSWARRVFDHFGRKSDDPALWNAMISGYGTNGENGNALEIFELMKKDDIKPNSATVTGILSACSHAGKVDKGLDLFKMVIRDYGLNPTPENFGCLVDLLGRAGRLDEAWNLIREVPVPLPSFYSSLLGACRIQLDDELGEEVSERLSELEPNDPTPLVVLSNIYAGQGRWSDVESVRELMTHRGLKKFPGYSLTGDTER